MARGKNIHLNEQQVAWLRDNWAALSLTALGTYLGMSEQTLSNHAKRLGLPPRRKGKRPWAQSRQPKGSTRFDFGPIGEQWLREHWDELPFPEMAEHFGCSVSSLRKWVRTLKGLPDKRGGARTGAGRIAGVNNKSEPEAKGKTYFAPVPFVLQGELRKRGIIGVSTFADAFEALARYDIHPFVRAWQLTPGHRYYVGECISPDGCRRSGAQDCPAWTKAARSALVLALTYLPVIKQPKN